MRHTLKIWPQYYCRVADGSKTFEVRENDRGFQNGDIVELIEFDPNPVGLGYTNSPPLTFKVGYVYHLDEKRVVFSLLPVDK